MKKYGKLSLLFLSAGILAMSCGVLALWKLTGNTGNILTTGSFQNRIVEKYRVPSPVSPGETVSKVVDITNTGTVDSYVRVFIEKMFGTCDENGTFLEDETLDPDVIRLTVNQNYWEKGQDGYYYYKKVLKAGTTTAEPLLKSYTLTKNTDNRYKGKEARIVVSMEAIQADSDVKEVWNVSAASLGISAYEQKGEAGKDTKVVYLGKNGGFQISETTTDLFSCFKNLTPGCSRTQVVQIENRSDEKTELFLHAEAMQQVQMTEEQQNLVRQMLEQYAVIEIREGDRVIYQGPVSGNLSVNGKNSMRQDISLGTFSGREARKLTVRLGLDPDMQTESQHLTGKVKWVFTAKGDDTVTTTISSGGGVRTGDTTPVLMCLKVLAASLLAMGTVMIVRKRGKKE